MVKSSKDGVLHDNVFSVILATVVVAKSDGEAEAGEEEIWFLVVVVNCNKEVEDVTSLEKVVYSIALVVVESVACNDEKEIVCLYLVVDSVAGVSA